MRNRSYSERYRRSVILAGIAVVFTILFLLATNIFGMNPLLTSENAEVYSVSMNGTEIDVDPEEIRDVLKDAYVVRSFRRQGSYLMADYPLEISVNDGGKPIHILFGKDVHCYSDGGGFIRVMENGAEIHMRVLEIINNR